MSWSLSASELGYNIIFLTSRSFLALEMRIYKGFIIDSQSSVARSGQKLTLGRAAVAIVASVPVCANLALSQGPVVL